MNVGSQLNNQKMLLNNAHASMGNALTTANALTLSHCAFEKGVQCENACNCLLTKTLQLSLLQDFLWFVFTLLTNKFGIEKMCIACHEHDSNHQGGSAQ